MSVAATPTVASVIIDRRVIVTLVSRSAANAVCRHVALKKATEGGRAITTITVAQNPDF